MHATSGDIPAEPVLTPELLLSAYAQGWFPMADPASREIHWYSPHPRAVFPLTSFHVPKSLARVVRSRKFEVRSDTAFAHVMRECAAPRPDDALTWIDQRLIEAYTALHELGYAHSVEAWREETLVGGLYGVALGGAFFGESMFSRPDLGGTNASKVCLVHLVGMMQREGFRLLDTQFATEHLEQFGCEEISRRSYLARLSRAVKMECEWGDVGVVP
jgi:leucyl/phenylalanyl-tRNA--protein transferase